MGQNIVVTYQMLSILFMFLSTKSKKMIYVLIKKGLIKILNEIKFIEEPEDHYTLIGLDGSTSLVKAECIKLHSN